MKLLNLNPASASVRRCISVRGWCWNRGSEKGRLTDVEVYSAGQGRSTPQTSEVSIRGRGIFEFLLKDLGEQRNRPPQDRAAQSATSESGPKHGPAKVRLTPQERMQQVQMRLRELANRIYECPAKGGKHRPTLDKMPRRSFVVRLGYTDSEIEKVVQAGPQRLAEIAESIEVDESY